MTRLVIFFLLLVTSLTMTGCVGLLVSPFKDASVSAGPLKNPNPSAITKKEARSISNVAVLSEAEFIQNLDPQTRLIYKYCMDIITSRLEHSKRFKVIYPTVFMKKAEQMNVTLDPMKITDAEFASAITSVAKAVKADAVVRLDVKQEKMNVFTTFLKFGFVGTVDVPMTVILQVLPGSKGSKDVLWIQEEPSTLTAGQMGLKNTPPEEMKKMAATVVDPLVANLIAGFGGGVSDIATDDHIETTTAALPQPERQKTEIPETKAAPPSSVTMVVASQKLRLRSGPSMKSTVIKTVKRGTDVEVLKVKNEWCLVQLSGGDTGWCLKEFLSQK